MAIAKKRKKFFDVEMPLIKKVTQLQAFEPKELEGRLINYDLTRSLRGKGVLLQLKVEYEQDKLISIPRQIKLMPYFIKRMVRKGTNYVEDSFSAECMDAQIRIKPFLITRRKVSRAVRKALREKAKEELMEYVKDKDAETLFRDILNNQIQKPLSLKLKKIYPLSLCEIRILKVEKRFEKKKPVEEKNKEVKEKKSKKEVEEKNKGETKEKGIEKSEEKNKEVKEKKSKKEVEEKNKGETKEKGIEKSEDKKETEEKNKEVKEKKSKKEVEEKNKGEKK